ncbi:MAG: CHAD domain-containing protein [Phycisphaerae bacterium]
MNTIELARYQSEQLDRLRKHLQEAIATGDVEAVHDLRVASRRLHDALALADAIHGHKRVRAAQRLLKRIRKAYRRVRDLDVLRVSLSDPTSATTLDTDSLAAIEAVFARRRRRALAAAARAGRRSRVTKGLAAIEKLIASTARFTQRKPELVEERLRDILRQRATDLLAADPMEENTDLHETRIRVKQLRYCVQLLEECGFLQAPDLMTGLTQMQTLLGQWSDRIVFAATLSRLAARRRVLTRQTAVSAAILKHTAIQVQASIEDRDRVLDRWPSLIVLVRRAVPGLVEMETAGADLSPSRVEADAGEGNG